MAALVHLPGASRLALGAIFEVTGVAMPEKSIGVRRPGYADCVARTSVFFPMPPQSQSTISEGQRT